MIIQWLKRKLLQRANKTRHNIIKLNWEKAELETLLEKKDKMTPEEFQREYLKCIARG